MTIEFFGQDENLRSFGRSGPPGELLQINFFYEAGRRENILVLTLLISEGGALEYELADWSYDNLTLLKPWKSEMTTFKKCFT